MSADLEDVAHGEQLRKLAAGIEDGPNTEIAAVAGEQADVDEARGPGGPLRSGWTKTPGPKALAVAPARQPELGR